jgi:hypothetical protein
LYDGWVALRRRDVMAAMITSADWRKSDFAAMLEGVRNWLAIIVVLAALAASPLLLPAGDNDGPEPAPNTGAQPCMVPASGHELCGHDAAAWCDMHRRGGGTGDACIRVLRWASD